ncbi:MAG: ATP-binding cassette domain-containing protein [Anaerolineales bacterium]|nr:ATP-binding cassette domain-containing protein [Anaerolineales bacterium]
MSHSIEAHGLSRNYGGLRAVDGLSLSVQAGELFALLGPNGGGKTTTLGMLTTLLRPSAGTARVAGYDVAAQPHEVRRCIGVVFQGPSLDEQLTARENLDFHARIYNLPRAVFRQRSDELLALVELAERQHEPVRNFSGGMRRRLELARGLMHQPQVLFLDEPTVGLDPQTRRAMWDYLHTLRQQSGVTIFLTTHYLEEAEGCDRVAILDSGTLAALDTPAALKATLGGDVLHFRVADVQAAEQLLHAEGLAVRRGPEGLAVEVGDGPQRIPELVAALERGGHAVQAVNLRRPSLEDVFIKLTGRAIRTEAPDAAEALVRRGRMGRSRR